MINKIHVMHTGSVEIDIALAYQEKSWHPAPYTGWFRPKSKKICVPVSAYLIEHPRGLVLIDTGWGAEMRNNAKKHLGFLASSMFKGHLPEGQAIHEQLRDKGFTDRDLDYVILTHLHSDHVSGVKHLTGAKVILTSELEWEAANKKVGYVRSMWKNVPIIPYELQDIPFGPYRKGIDLYGDGAIYLVHTPGHSKGQLSVLVKMNRGWVLLASDVGYSASSWENDRLPGITANEEEAKASLSWVKSFAESSSCISVLANHDPQIVPHTIADQTF